MSEQVDAGLDVSTFAPVIETGEARLRRKLAGELGRLLADAETPASERQAVMSSVLKLAVDPVADVRRALVVELERANFLEADLLFTVVADDDGIALPFLAATPALDEFRALAILEAGDAARQAVVAGRPDVSALAVDEIVTRGCLDACVALLDNPDVRLQADQYRTLYLRFGQSTEIVERLIARHDLPLDIRILQTKRASSRIHQLMAERGWVAANDASEVVADAEESAILHILVNAGKEELPRTIAFLTAKNMLLPSIVLRAACLGEMQVVERTLAHLADLPAARTRRLIYATGMGGIRSLHSKTGLPAACLGLLKAAADVTREAREEGLRIGAESFGRRLIEVLMTQHAHLPTRERARHLDFVARYADERVRPVARRLKSSLLHAA